MSLTISPIKDDRGNVIGAAKIIRDITESKKIERALRMTEKLATAGRLAATVAHEVNNPLEAITNLVYLARRDRLRYRQSGRVIWSWPTANWTALPILLARRWDFIANSLARAI